MLFSHTPASTRKDRLTLFPMTSDGLYSLNAWIKSCWYSGNAISLGRGDGGIRRFEDEGDSESSLDLNAHDGHSNLGYFGGLPSRGDSPNRFCVSASLSFGDCVYCG
jgi:hypothetical protein